MFMIVQGQIHSKLQDQDVPFWNAFPQQQLLPLEVKVAVYKYISMQIIIIIIKTNNKLLMIINNVVKM